MHIKRIPSLSHPSSDHPICLLTFSYLLLFFSLDQSMGLSSPSLLLFMFPVAKPNGHFLVLFLLCCMAEFNTGDHFLTLETLSSLGFHITTDSDFQTPAEISGLLYSILFLFHTLDTGVLRLSHQTSVLLYLYSLQTSNPMALNTASHSLEECPWI